MILYLKRTKIIFYILYFTIFDTTLNYETQNHTVIARSPSERSEREGDEAIP